MLAFHAVAVRHLDAINDPNARWQHLLDAWLIRLRIILLALVSLLSVMVPSVLSLLLVPTVMFIDLMMMKVIDADVGQVRRELRMLFSLIHDIALSYMVFMTRGGLFDLYGIAPIILSVVIFESGIMFGFIIMFAMTAFSFFIIVLLLYSTKTNLISDAPGELYTDAAGPLVCLVMIYLIELCLIHVLRVWADFERQRTARSEISLKRLQTGISPREWEVVDLVVKTNLSYSEIGVSLGIGTETVKTYVGRTGKKLGLKQIGRRSVSAEITRLGLICERDDDAT